MSQPSLPPYGAPLVLRPRRSRTAGLLWVLQLAVLAAAALAIDGPAYGKISALLGWLAYAGSCRPRLEPTLVSIGDGAWALPHRPAGDLALGPGTAYTRQWIDLRLVAASGERHKALIWVDALAADDWRRLQLAVREARWPRAATGRLPQRPGPLAHWT